MSALSTPSTFEASPVTQIIESQNQITVSNLNGSLSKYDTRFLSNALWRQSTPGISSIDVNGSLVISMCTDGYVRIWGRELLVQRESKGRSVKSHEDSEGNIGLIVSTEGTLEYWRFEI